MTTQQFTQALAKLGLNTRQAAERFGLHEVHISRIKNGGTITKRMEIQIRDALKIQKLEAER